MANEERRDDWRNGVDKKLVDLTSAQRSTDDELDDLDLKYDVLDKIMRGDPENDHIGFDERLRTIETGLRELRAEKVKFKVADTAVQGFKWQFWQFILAALIAAVGSYVLRPVIEAKLRQKETDPIAAAEDRVENPPKRRHRHGALRPKPIPDEPTETETSH